MEASVGPDETWGWKGGDNADREVASTNFPQIRLFKLHHKIALKPIADAEADGWTPVTPTSASSFSAVAYFFGRELHQRYHVPMGLIDSSWGATVAEAWTSEGSLKRFPEFQQSIVALKKNRREDRSRGARAIPKEEITVVRATWPGGSRP